MHFSFMQAGSLPVLWRWKMRNERIGSPKNGHINGQLSKKIICPTFIKVNGELTPLM